MEDWFCFWCLKVGKSWGLFYDWPNTVASTLFELHELRHKLAFLQFTRASTFIYNFFRFQISDRNSSEKPNSFLALSNSVLLYTLVTSFWLHNFFKTHHLLLPDLFKIMILMTCFISNIYCKQLNSYLKLPKINVNIPLNYDSTCWKLNTSRFPLNEFAPPFSNILHSPIRWLGSWCHHVPGYTSHKSYIIV